VGCCQVVSPFRLGLGDDDIFLPVEAGLEDAFDQGLAHLASADTSDLLCHGVSVKLFISGSRPAGWMPLGMSIVEMNIKFN
jgi:hypothetical protein